MFLTLTGLAIAGLVTVGVSLLSLGGCAIISSKEAKEQAKEYVEAYKKEIKNLESDRRVFEDLKSELSYAMKKLTSSKDQFKNGGCVISGKPLASDQFESCYKYVNDSKWYVEQKISEIDQLIDKCEKEIKNLKSEYNI